MAYELAAPRRYLFVVSHMRSYSTLLCHILNTSAEIDGYVEMHHAYRGERDLLELYMRVQHTVDRNRPTSGRYVVDKLLHNNAELADAILRRDDVFTIFSVREPERTVRSIVAMGQRRNTKNWKRNPAKVVGHYVARLETLNQTAARAPQRSLFVEADELLHQTEPVLAAITRLLELRQPLTPEYEISALTGGRRLGDASRFITTGTIVKDRDDYGHIEVPERLMRQAWDAYHRSRELLTARCSVAIPGPVDARSAAPA